MWFGRERRTPLWGAALVYLDPMVLRTLFLLPFLLVPGLPTAFGQLGIVWEAPPSTHAALADLVEMRVLGFRAVRTGPVTDSRILAAADSMGMVLYRDIGFERLMPGAWADTLQAATARVDAIAASPYAGWIGLGSWTATNLPATCATIEALAQRVRDAGHKAYYVTPFMRRDRCSHVVDAVLVDQQDHADPDVERADMVTVGLEVGPGGDMERHRAEFTSRILALSRERVVFIHRWRDQPMRDPWMKRYGLYDEAGNPRPMVAMLREAHLTGQPVFARQVREDTPSATWSVLVGWLLIACLAMLHATSPRFRQMIPRYFLAHGFYRNAVREAREVLPLTSTALISIVGLSAGLMVAVVLHGLHDRAIGTFVYGHLPDGAMVAASALMRAPIVLVVLSGSVILLAMAVWMSMWVLAVGRQQRLLASQALMLAVWPRWQAVALLPVAMVLGPPGLTGTWTLAAAAVLFVATLLWSVVRTASDMMRVARVPRPIAVLLVLVNPEVMFVMVILTLATINSSYARMVWDLLSRN